MAIEIEMQVEHETEANKEASQITFATPTIRYLGNKRRLIPKIAEIASSFLQPGCTFVDLFAGSCSVGYHMLPKYRVISNDVEAYSYCIAKALIEDCRYRVTREEITEILKPFYEENLAQLTKHFDDYLKMEKYFLQSPSLLRIYGGFCRLTPYVGNYTHVHCPDAVKVLYEEERCKDKFPYCLFSTYFANGYFGILQCLQIDSIRYAIDKAMVTNHEAYNKDLSYKLITALIYAMSHCVSSPGHFAQFNKPNNSGIGMTLLKNRSQDIWDLFINYVDKLFDEPVHNAFQNKAYNLDALAVLSELSGKLDSNALIYIDPPYTADQYSRFYHVLNTLLQYDYPKCTGMGRYRENRYTSPFSLQSKSENEMKKLLAQTSAMSTRTVVSYIDEGIINLKTLEGICKEYFPVVDITEIDYNHSNQGRSAVECSKRKPRRKEMLYICSNK